MIEGTGKRGIGRIFFAVMLADVIYLLYICTRKKKSKKPIVL